MALAWIVGLTARADASDGVQRPAPAIRWEPVPVEASGDVVTALALDVSGRLAIGDARGVRLGVGMGMGMDVGMGVGEAAPRRIALRGAVQDLAFFDAPGEDGPVLLAATTSGLYRIGSDGMVESISTGPGLKARAVSRIRVLDDLIAVATGDGPYVSSDARHWRRLSNALPSGAATAIALRESGNRIECWVAMRGELWLSPLSIDSDPSATDAPIRVPIPFVSSQRSVNEIEFDVGPAEVVVVLDSTLVVRWKSDGRWDVIRPSLPPGAQATRVSGVWSRFWLATSRGLLMSGRLEGPWSRVLAAAGSSPAQDLALGEGALYAATEDGLWVGRPSSRAAFVPTSATTLDPTEPDVHSVHRAALRYLDLRPARIAELRRGVARRGWLPILALRAIADGGRSRNSDYDEAWLSGDLRRLNDRDEDRHRDLQLQLTVSWDFGDVAFHPEAIDVSREAREIIELRDDVLDEINQLYFERRRVLAELAAQTDPAAAHALRPRAEQLAAGIDAWTGGWYSRQLSVPTP